MKVHDERILGHIVHTSGVRRVFQSKEGEQYIFAGGEKLFGRHLQPGQNWRNDLPPNPTGMSESRFRLLAFHEAGHAAASLSIEVEVEFVSVFPQYPSAATEWLASRLRFGCCQCDYTFFDAIDTDSIKTRKILAVIFGGFAAERILWGRETTEREGFWAQDRRDRKRHSKGIPPETLRAIENAVSHHFTTVWNRIELLATALLTFGAIDGLQARQTFGVSAIDFDFGL